METSAPLVMEPPYLTRLNPPQREAVLSTEGPVLMLAGAGTGKTAALTARLAHILNQRLAWPSEILGLTFTNKAAAEMRERVRAHVGDAIEGMPWLGTFHSIGARLLRRHAELVGLQANFTILDTDDQLRLLKQLIIAEGLDEKRFPARLLGGLIDRWKNKGLSPADLDTKESYTFANGKGQVLYAAYQARLKALNACDFGDLLLHWLDVLKRERAVLEGYQQRFKYILVDEYQDTNIVQYLILRLLAQTRKNICCVGDDDQSIYSWRGAEVANILKFEADFPGAKIIRLEQNYRSTPHILAAASGLIAHNGTRLGKTLWTEAQSGEKVRVEAVWDGAEEARRVSDEIERIQREGGRANDCAILVRAQFQTREFEDRFIATGTPYRIIGGFRFYERAEIRDALAYLRVVQQPADDLAFERIINVPKRGLGDKAVQRVQMLARRQGCALVHGAALILDSDELTPQARRALGSLVGDIARWRDAAKALTPADLVRQILDECGYTAMLQADKSPESAGRMENLAELARAMEEYDTLGDFLEHVSLVMDNDARDAEDKVTLMTIHAAKGLEFRQTFLVGWEEGVFPSQRALDEGGLASLEEERRLAYVAITRARESCIILHAANRRIYGQWTSSIPSRFIDELPPEHIRQDTTMTGMGTMGWATSSQQPIRAVAARSSAKPAGWSEAPRADVAPGSRVFHTKFGYGTIAEIDGNRLE
ncbi:MAG: UvrD-helicase domain-containing protein, partial [Alphaproteobacteria bacterium]|nr:UvrD-helicase domain-containing protein [Alphaproteobacteria bacterium]